MKKRMIMLAITAILLVCAGIGAYAAVQAVQEAQHLEALEENASLLEVAIDSTIQPSEISEQEASALLQNDTKQFNLSDYLRSKGYYEDDVVIILQKYIDNVVLYGLNQAQSDYIISLCDLGYDFERLMDIYQFLQTTQDRDIALLKPMYETAKGTFESKFWVENAYAKIKGWTQNTLTMEEIMEYTNQGITIEEIALVYQLSLLGNCTEREMLDSRVQGVSWAQIFAEACGDPLITDKLMGEDLAAFIPYLNAAQILNQPPSAIVNSGENGIALSTEANEILEDKTQIKATLVEEFCDFSAPIQDAKEEIPQLDEEVLQNLISDGYRIRDIKVAVSDPAPQKAACQEIKDKIAKDAMGGEVK